MQSDFSIQQIMQGDAAQLSQLFSVAAHPDNADFLRRTKAHQLFDRLFHGDALDAALAPPLSKLQQAFILHTRDQDNFYCTTNHPWRDLFECLLQRGRTWYPRDSKPSQQFFERLNALLNTACDTANPQLLASHLSDFQEWLKSEDKRATMLEARLCEAEINNLKALTAECNALDAINNALAHTQFPLLLNSGIGTLKSELQHCLLTGGSDSPVWKTWQRLLPLLGKVFTPDELDEQLLYRQVPAMLNELERSLQFNISNPDFYQQWVADLSQCLMAAVKKQEQETASFSPLPYPEGYSNLTRVTQAVLQQGNSLQQGDWILFTSENNQVIRCKLALKNPDTDQLLFVDSTGRKVMIKSTKDVSVCLSTGIAKPFSTIQLDDVITQLLAELKTTAAQNQAQRLAEEAEQQRKAQMVAELEYKLELQKQANAKALQQRQLAAENAARRAAAQKALAEARALAEEKARRQAEQAEAEAREHERLVAAETAEYLQRLQLANIQISSLNLGARIELVQNDNVVRCKLAVIIAATGKYIFVDNLGRKVAELQREQLIQAVLDNQLSLVNNGDSFDDQLVKVIRGLRKDIS